MTPKVYNRGGLRFEISELPKPNYEKEDYCVVFFSTREKDFLKDLSFDRYAEEWKKKLVNFLYSPLDKDEGSAKEEFLKLVRRMEEEKSDQEKEKI